MNTHLDIIGSIMIAGMLMLAFVRFNGDRQDAMLEATNHTMNQEAVSSVTMLLMSDLRKCGYRCPGEAFLTIQQKRIVFLGDVDDNGSIDTVKYWFATPAASTPNPNDSLLYRQVNGGPAAGSSLGIVDFTFRYYNASGSVTTSQTAVRAVAVDARIQSMFTAGGAYQESRTQFRITPRNNK